MKDSGFNPRSSHTKDLMVLDTSLLNTRHYKVRIKGKVEQSRERSSALPLVEYLWQKGPSGRPRLRSPILLTLIR